MSHIDGTTLHQTLESWRAAARDLADLPADSAARDGLRETVDRLPREYLAGLKELLPHLSEPADVADQLAQVSDDFLATAHELETLIRHRETAASQDRQAFDRAIDRASSELLRLSTLQRQAGDAVPTQPGTTIEDADGRAT